MKGEKAKGMGLASRRSRLLTIDEDYIPWRLAIRITLFYTALSGAWILLSDELLAEIVQDRQMLIYISMAKGWFYVFVSGAWIFTIVHSSLKAIKQNELKLKESRDRLLEEQHLSTAVIEQMSDAFALFEAEYDRQGQPVDFICRMVNSSFAAFARLQKKELLGCSLKELVQRTGIAEVDWLGVFICTAKTRHPQVFNSYSIMLEKWHTVSVYSPQEGVVISVFHDITEIKNQQANVLKKSQQLEEMVMLLEESQEELEASNASLRSYQEKLQHVAYYDHLTGLANRFLLQEDLKQCLCGRDYDKIALLFVDADNIKLVNDTLGHSYGDQLIIGVGNRLVSVLGNSQYVYRLGGDEFIIWQGYYHISEVERIAARLVQSFKIPLSIQNTLVHTTVSVGIALYPSDANDTDELLKCADIALYRAKAAGKNCYRFYDTEMRTMVERRMDIEKYLRTALEREELEVYYQPQINILTNELVGFEALLRWFNPQLGRVDTHQFIKVAEDTHLIMPIGDWVLRQACSFINSLHEKGHTGLTVSVNISMLQLLQDDFISSVIAALTEARLEPQYLELEITESILMETYETIRQKLEWLQDRGVRIALDDFGKGYSSLSYLDQLPITTLKIDKTFTDSITDCQKDQSIMDGIVMIGRKMGMTVVAEGVETQTQLDYLISNRCHIAQGFIFSRPLSQWDAEQYADNHILEIQLDLCDSVT